MFERTKRMARSLSGNVIEMAISILVIAILVGVIAFPLIMGVDVRGWDAMTIFIWCLIPTVCLAAIVIGLSRYLEKGKAE